MSKPAATSRPRPPSEEDVQGYIDNYARQVIAKSATPLTREQAIARVVDERPHLYQWHKEALQRRQASAVRPTMDLAEVNDRVVVKSAAGWSIEQEATRRYPDLGTAGAVDAFMQTPEGHAAYRRYRELEQ